MSARNRNVTNTTWTDEFTKVTTFQFGKTGNHYIVQFCEYETPYDSFADAENPVDPVPYKDVIVYRKDSDLVALNEPDNNLVIKSIRAVRLVEEMAKINA